MDDLRAFFPPETLGDSGLDSVRRIWYAGALYMMEESPLYPPVANRFLEYRLLYLPTFTHPYMVRLIEEADVWQVICKRTDGQGGYGFGYLVQSAKRILTKLEVEQFRCTLEGCDFWNMSSSYEECGGTDGAQVVLEGVGNGIYHVVERWAPYRTRYAALAKYMLSLTHHLIDDPEDVDSYICTKLGDAPSDTQGEIP